MPRIQVSEGELLGHDLTSATTILKKFAPKQASAANAFSHAVYQNTKLPFRVVEGARLRTAQINGCMTCQTFRAARDLAPSLGKSGTDTSNSFISKPDATTDEAFYEAIEHWKDSPVFSEKERLAIEFAERMGTDPQGFQFDEEFWKRMHAAFSDEEIVDLTLAVGCWIAMGRTAHILEIDPVVCAAPVSAT